MNKAKKKKYTWVNVTSQYVVICFPCSNELDIKAVIDTLELHEHTKM